jgi:hypothetical protein
MPNFQASTSVSAFHPISAVHDCSGNPAVFSIGTDHQLWVAFRDPQAPTGWQQVSLTGELPSAIQVSAFDTTQLFNGAYAIAIATAPDAEGASSDVYLTGWLDNDFTATDWSGFASQWLCRSAVIPLDPDDPAAGSQPLNGAVATDVLLGNQGSADKPAALIVVTQEDADANHYFVNTDSASTQWSWAVYPLPENPDQILGIAFGYVPAGPGVFGTYLLYELGGTRELYFVGAVTPVADQGAYNLKLDVDQAAQCIAALADPAAPHYSNLYTGGSGVDVYSHQTQTLGKALGGGSGVRLLESDSGHAISELELAQDSANVSIWMLAPATQTLWYSTGEQGAAPGEWTTPIPLQQHVAHITALRHPSRHANQLVTALTDNRLNYQWQDPATSLWRVTDIPLQDVGAARQFTSYTSTLHFEDQQQNALAGMAVDLTSSQWGYVTINGYVWELSPDNPVTLNTDNSGNLTIVAPTLTLATPVYHVRPHPETQANNLNPANNAIERLSRIQTAQDLLEQFPDLDPDTAELGAKTLSTLTAYLASLPTDGSNADGSQPTSTLPDQLWGGDLSSGSLTAYTYTADTLLLAAPPRIHSAMRTTQFNVIGTVEDVAGDVLHALEAGIEAIGEFLFSVAKGVLRFAVKIAGKWLHFVVASIGAALELINWVIYKVLGIDLEKILAWLGFLFDWGDIVDTHKVFSNLSRQTMNMLRADLPSLQRRIDSAFNQILSSVDALGDHPLLAPDGPYASISVNQVAHNVTASAADSDGVNSALYGSGGSFSSYQAQHGGILNGPAPEYGTGDQPIQDFVNNTLLPTLKQMSDEIYAAFQTMVRDYQAGTLTLGEVIGLLSKTLVESVIDLLKVIVDGLFAVAESLLDVLDHLLFDEIDIPLLTALYKLVTDGSEMSLMDGLSLLASIPATIFYKLVAGQAPFADGSYGLDSAGSYKEILEILDGGSLPSPKAAMATSAKQAESGSVEASTVYSQIGGSIAILTGFINSFVNMGQGLSEGQLKFAAKIAMGTRLLYMAGSMPFDQADELQQQMGDIVYLGNAIDTLIQGAMFLSNRAAEPEELIFKGGYDLLMDIGDLVAFTVSFIDKLTLANQHGDDTGLIIEAYVQSILTVIATATGAVGTIAGDENPEIELPAFAITGGLQFIIATLGLLRACTTIQDDVRFFID